MPKESPFFKFDAQSWLSGSIQFTSLECKGLFTDLCALYWDSQKPIKIDAKLLARVRVPQDTLSTLIGSLSDLEVIFVSASEITIPFIDKLIAEREEWLEKCAKGGKASRVLKGTPKTPPSNKKEESRKKNVESRKKRKEYTPQFDELWNIYGLKGSKSKSFDQWNKLTDEEKDDAAKAMPDYLREKPEKTFRKDFERYLSHKVFEDVLERKKKGELDIPEPGSGSGGKDRPPDYRVPVQHLSSMPTEEQYKSGESMEGFPE